MFIKKRTRCSFGVKDKRFESSIFLKGGVLGIFSYFRYDLVVLLM